ncbi:MAG: ATP-binding protein [Alistipes sp.]|nr:ATP-binding protein [Alistipes sp.]
MKISTIEDVQRLIDDCVVENTSLEYKAGIDLNGKKDWRRELAKDVSAMANANGGTIIFGLCEIKEEGKPALPGAITPLDSTVISKERLEQVIYSNISPKIEGIEITSLPADLRNPKDVIYIVNIPQGNTAHQNTISRKYYKRRNTTIDAMEDYEIRDIMNRNSVPNIELVFEIERRNPVQAYVIQPVYHPELRTVIPQMVPQNDAVCVLCCKPVNTGNVIAENLHYFIEIPENMVKTGNSFDIIKRENGYITIHRENLYCDILEGSTPQNIKFGNPRIVPVLPHTTGVYKHIILSELADFDSTAEIRWRLNADCAPQKSGSIRFCDIPRKF